MLEGNLKHTLDKVMLPEGELSPDLQHWIVRDDPVSASRNVVLLCDTGQRVTQAHEVVGAAVQLAMGAATPNRLLYRGFCIMQCFTDPHSIMTDWQCKQCGVSSRGSLIECQNSSRRASLVLPIRRVRVVIGRRRISIVGRGAISAAVVVWVQAVGIGGRGRISPNAIAVVCRAKAGLRGL